MNKLGWIDWGNKEGQKVLPNRACRSTPNHWHLTPAASRSFTREDIQYILSTVLLHFVYTSLSIALRTRGETRLDSFTIILGLQRVTFRNVRRGACSTAGSAGGDWGCPKDRGRQRSHKYQGTRTSSFLLAPFVLCVPVSGKHNDERFMSIVCYWLRNRVLSTLYSCLAPPWTSSGAVGAGRRGVLQDQAEHEIE